MGLTELDRNGAKPLHAQLEEMIREKIRTGQWPVGQRMPSENKISQELGISRMTIRNVITKLEQEGLVERAMGKGTFVCAAKMQGSNIKRYSIISQLEAMGHVIETKVLSLEQKVIPAVAKQFNLPEYTYFYAVKRLRYMDGEPVSAHITYFPISLTPKLEEKDMERRELYKIMEEDYGIVKGKLSETWEAGRAPRALCEEMKIGVTHPILIGHNTAYYAGSTAVLTLETQYYRGDKITLQLEFD